jgi:hypothetical protein
MEEQGSFPPPEEENRANPTAADPVQRDNATTSNPVNNTYAEQSIEPAPFNFTTQPTEVPRGTSYHHHHQQQQQQQHGLNIGHAHQMQVPNVQQMGHGMVQQQTQYGQMGMHMPSMSQKTHSGSMSNPMSSNSMPHHPMQQMNPMSHSGSPLNMRNPVDGNHPMPNMYHQPVNMSQMHQYQRPNAGMPSYPPQHHYPQQQQTSNHQHPRMNPHHSMGMNHNNTNQMQPQIPYQVQQMPSSSSSSSQQLPATSFEFEVTLQKGEYGLCMNMGVKMGGISVLGFRQPQPGLVGPAEASGKIQIGDDLIAVDGVVFTCADDFKKVVPLLKSDAPTTLRFRRHHEANTANTQHRYNNMNPDTNIVGNNHAFGGTNNVAPPGTGVSGKVYAPGEVYLGVRYVAPGRWTAEVKTQQQQQQQIIRLGEFPSEQAAAHVYNSYIYRNYGQQAIKFMHPAGRSQAHPMQGAPPIGMSNIHPMMQHHYSPPQQPYHPFGHPQPPHMASSSSSMPPPYMMNHAMPKIILHAMFTIEQKEQLRAQIMVFKFSMSGNAIPPQMLQLAVGFDKDISALEFHRPRPKERSRKTFRDDASPQIKRRRGRPRKKKQRGDDDSDEDESETDDAAFMGKGGAATTTTVWPTCIL